jgi:triacylglycerol lipase
MRITWQDLLWPGSGSSFFVRDPLPVFDPHRADYSSGNAWWLAELSRIVYRLGEFETSKPARPLRREFLKAVGFEEIGLFRSDETGTAALLVQSLATEPFSVLVFRGTEQEIQDLLMDVDTLPVPAFDNTALVHRGCKRALNSVWTPIEAALRTIEGPLFYTGHSLGAALATLAAVRRAPTALYTFGSPRVGDIRLAGKLKAVPTFRVVHGKDIVTTVPPELLGFRHLGEEHHIGTSGLNELQLDPRLIFDQLTTPIAPLADHAPINYANMV